MKKQLSMLAILVGASLNAQAAQSSFFTITEVGQGYATGISADNNVAAGFRRAAVSARAHPAGVN